MSNPLNKLHLKRGYTLLFAVLIASLVLGVAVFILSISRKQYILSATARESLYAMYASDSGIECGALDANRSEWGDAIEAGQTVPFSCAGTSQLVTFSTHSSYPYFDVNNDSHSLYVDSNGVPHPEAVEGDFRLVFREYSTGSPTGKITTCALMSIIGYTIDPGGPDERNRTIIQSRGYNVCKARGAGAATTYGPDTSSPRTVERARQLIYE
ncbi:MAG: hypothetical protein V4481_05655 [Patescibacteria group bacterium]